MLNKFPGHLEDVRLGIEQNYKFVRSIVSSAVGMFENSEVSCFVSSMFSLCVVCVHMCVFVYLCVSVYVSGCGVCVFCVYVWCVCVCVCAASPPPPPPPPPAKNFNPIY